MRALISSFMLPLALLLCFYGAGCKSDNDDSDDTNSDSTEDDDTDEIDDDFSDDDQSDDDDDDDSDDDDDADDDSGDDDDVSTPIPCGESVSPSVSNVTLLVNGSPVTMPATVQEADSLAVSFDYSDGDCTMKGEYLKPGVRITVQQPDFDLYDYLKHDYTLDENLIDECSSEEFGAPYTLELNPSDYVLPESMARTLPLIFLVYDSCGLSNDKHEDRTYVDFTVVPKE